MLTALFLPPLLALGLIGGGVALIAYAIGYRKSQVAARVSMIAPAGPLAPRPGAGAGGASLVRATGKKAPSL